MGWKTEKTRMNRLVSLKIATETIQNETGREKKVETNNEHSLSQLWGNFKWLNIHVIGVPEVRMG